MYTFSISGVALFVWAWSRSQTMNIARSSLGGGDKPEYRLKVSFTTVVHDETENGRPSLPSNR